MFLQLDAQRRKAGPTPSRRAAEAATRAPHAGLRATPWWQVGGRYLAHQRAAVDRNAGGGQDRARALGLAGPKAPRVTVLREPIPTDRAARKAERAARRVENSTLARLRRQARADRKAARRAA